MTKQAQAVVTHPNIVLIPLEDTIAFGTKKFPKVGDSVIILHQVKRSNDKQTVLGVQRVDGKPVTETITAVYLDGTVRTGLSDVWEVKPSSGKYGGFSKWETVNPDHV